MTQSWPEFLKDELLFGNAIRLRYFIWTMQRRFPTGSKVLEVGFGSGSTAMLLADMGYQVTASDIDGVLVDTLRERAADWVRRGRLEVLKADMLKLPWQDQVFDVAYHQGVLEHFQDTQIVQALQEQRRVARWVFFDVPNIRHKVQTYGDERLLSPSHWRGLIQKAGLELVEEKGRDFQRWMYGLPFALFSRWGLDRTPWFGRRFGINSIFLCRSPLVTSKG